MGKEIIIVTISLGNDGAERILTELARQWHHDLSLIHISEPTRPY